MEQTLVEVRPPSGFVPPPSPERVRAPQLRLETFVVSDPRSDSGRRRSVLFPVSLLLHVGVVGVWFAVWILGGEPLPEASTAVRAFFVAPPAAPPPPPPPPPPAAKAVVRRLEVKPREPDRFTAPRETPDSVRPEESVDLGSDLGAPSGVEGGVPGGVVGGIVGGLPDAPAAAPQVYRVGGDIREPRKLKNVNPIYPERAQMSGVQGAVVLECLVSPAGKVVDIKVLRTIPLLDEAAIQAVKQWIYTPTLVGGVAVPILMTVTVNFKLN